MRPELCVLCCRPPHYPTSSFTLPSFFHTSPRHATLHCTLPCHTVLYCALLCCMVLFFTLFRYRTALCSNVRYDVAPYLTCHTMPFHTILCRSLQRCPLPTPFVTILHCSVLYYSNYLFILLFCMVLCCTCRPTLACANFNPVCCTCLRFNSSSVLRFYAVLCQTIPDYTFPCVTVLHVMHHALLRRCFLFYATQWFGCLTSLYFLCVCLLYYTCILRTLLCTAWCDTVQHVTIRYDAVLHDAWCSTTVLYSTPFPFYPTLLCYTLLWCTAVMHCVIFCFPTVLLLHFCPLCHALLHFPTVHFAVPCHAVLGLTMPACAVPFSTGLPFTSVYGLP